MIVIANRSSTTAKVSRNVRNAAGRWVLMTARTASAKAMSVAVGIAQPCSAPPPRVRVDEHEQDRRARHAPEGGDDWQCRSSRVAQVAGDELALELQSGHEEEDRQQPVAGPRAQRQVQVQRLGTDGGVAQSRVGVGPRRVGPHQGDRGRASSRAPPTVSRRSSAVTRETSSQLPLDNSGIRWGGGVGRRTGMSAFGVGQHDADQTSLHTVNPILE